MNLETFEKFSLMHAIVVIVSALIVAIVVFLSRKIRAKSPAKADRFRLGMGIAVVAFQILHNIYWLFLRDNGFDLYESLPLHFCDISGLVAAAALLFPLAVTTGYVLALLALNIVIDANYGYVGRESQATEFLGAWPFPRLPLIFLGGAVLEIAAWLPFGIMARLRTRRPARP